MESPPPLPSSARPSQRPTSIAIFGILNIVFGVLGLCGSIGGFAIYVIPEDFIDKNDLMMQIMRGKEYLLFLLIVGGLGSVVRIALIGAGVALLQNHDLGRKLSIGCGVYGVVEVIVGIVGNWILVYQPVLEQATTTAETIAAYGGIVAGVVGTLISLIYPILLLIWMYKPSVKSWLAGER